MVAPHENPGDLHGYCGGRDLVLSSCTCTDFVLVMELRILNAETLTRSLYCFCCKLPIVDPLRRRLPPLASPPA